MRSLDTNLLLRLVLDDIPTQTKAVEKLLSQTNEQLAVADMAFAEMVWILQGRYYDYSRKNITDNIYALLNLQQLNCNREMLKCALPLYKEHTNISFVDACLSAYAELNNAAPLLTYDKNLVKKLPKTTQLMEAN